MAVAVFSIVFIAVILALLTAGVVLCLHLWARRRLGIQMRVLVATILGPGSLFLVPFVFELVDGGQVMGELGIGLVFVTGFFSLIVGWPTAAILTRQLERSLLPDARVFE